MNYLLINNDIFIDKGQGGQRLFIPDNDVTSLAGLDQAKICQVDVDVMIASAPENFVDQKDSLLAQKFEELYPGEYVIQDEKIADNLFQIIGIKAEKVKAIYDLVPPSKVEALVPYAIAIRSLLVHQQIDMNRPIVFVDDLGNEKLLTVFEGLKFSRTRTIHAEQTESILSDLKRSQIDFHKKLGEFANTFNSSFTVIINNPQMADEIKALEPGFSVEVLAMKYPALEGLKYMDAGMKYRIREDIIQERRKKERESQLLGFMLSAAICTAGLLFFGINQVQYTYLQHQLEIEQTKKASLEPMLEDLDQKIYRDFLRRSKKVDYAHVFFQLSNLLPDGYEISSFNLTQEANHRTLSAYVFSADGGFYDPLPRIKLLKNALMKDFFIQGHPGKYLKINL